MYKGIGTTVSSILIIIILLMFLITYIYMVNENVQGKTFLNLDEAAMLRTENTFYLVNASLGMTWFISTAQSIFRTGDESIGCGYDEYNQFDPPPSDLKDGYWYQGMYDRGKPGSSLCTNVMPQGIKYNTYGCNPMICLPSDEHFKNYLLAHMKKFHDIKLELNDVNGVKLIQIADIAKENINTVFKILEDMNRVYIETSTTQKIYIEDNYGTKIDTTTTNNAVVNTYMKNMVDAARAVVQYLFFISESFPDQYQYKQIQNQFGYNGEVYTNYIKSSIITLISAAETDNLKNSQTGEYMARINVEFDKFEVKARTNEDDFYGELFLHYDGLVKIIEGQEDVSTFYDDFEWPTGNGGSRIITTCYGSRKPPTPGASAFHLGLDIAPLTGNNNDPIFPARDGKVIGLRDICSSSITCTGYGNYVIIEHDDGYQTYYAHLDDVLVSVGDDVKTNEIIGHMGTTGTSTGIHLHFEIRKNSPLDPCGFINCDESTNVKCPVLTLSEEQVGYYYHDESRNRFVKRPFVLVFGIEDYLPVLRCSYSGAPKHEFYTWEKANDIACCGSLLWVCCSDSACNDYPKILDIENMESSDRKVPSGKTIREHDTSYHCDLPIRCSGGTFIFP